MIQFSKKLVGKSCLVLVLSVSSGNTSSDMLDYYMMGVLPSITANQYEPVIVPKTSSDPSVNMKSYHSTVVNFIHTYKKYDDSNTKLVKIASGNFTQIIDNYDMTSLDLQAFSDEWLSNLSKTSAALLYINYLNELQVKIPESSVQVGVVIARPRIAFTTAVLLAGIAFGLEQGMEYIYDSIQDYNHIGENTISGATGAELEDINVNVLHINRDATAQEALAEYNSLDFITKARLVGHVSESNAEAGDGQTEPERREGFSELSKKLGRAAVTTTVGLEVSATGGQFIDKVAAATGLSANAAAVIDLGVTVMGKQPLDYLIMATESESKTNQTVPASSMSHQEAVETLDSARKEEDVKIEKVIEATKKIVNETARLVPDAKIFADGSVEVPIPDKMDLRLIDKLPVGDTTIKVRDLEQFDILLQAEGMYPERFVDINKTNAETMNIDLMSLPECPMILHNLPDDFKITINKRDKDGDGWYEDRTYCNYWASGDLRSQSPYIDDEFHGFHIGYESPGVMDYSTQYAYGKKDGIDRDYDQYGRIMTEMTYSSHILHGLTTYFYRETGKVSGLKNYINGVMRYKKVFAEKGFLTYELYQDSNGLKDGTERSYYLYSGMLRSEAPWVHGVAHGLYKFYYESGQVANEFPYVDGKINGIKKYYYESGALASEHPTVDDKSHGELKYYSEDGRMTRCEIYDMGTYIGSCMP